MKIRQNKFVKLAVKIGGQNLKNQQYRNLCFVVNETSLRNFLQILTKIARKIKCKEKGLFCCLNSRKEMYSKYIFVRDKIIKEKIIALCHINEVWVRNCHD